MSTTKSDDHDTRKTYATLRIVGDNLNPEDITRILRIVPTISYVKGGKYIAGKRTGELVGKTSIWAFSTDRLVASDALQHHIDYILGILVPSRQGPIPLFHLHSILAKNEGLRAELLCFWHGRYGAKRPSIPKYVTEAMQLIPATIETDFDTDDIRQTA
jgi:hypothetical protein